MRLLKSLVQGTKNLVQNLPHSRQSSTVKLQKEAGEISKQVKLSKHITYQEAVQKSQCNAIFQAAEKKVEDLLDGVFDNQIHELSSKGILTVKRKLKSIFEKAYAQAKAKVMDGVSYCKNDAKQLEEELETEKQEAKDRFLIQNARAYSRDRRKAERPGYKIKALQEKLKRVVKRKKEAGTARAKVLKDVYKNITPNLKWYHIPLALWAFMGSLFPTEAWMLQVAISNLPDADMGLALLQLLCITFAGILVLGAHFTGSMLAKKGRTNKWLILTPLATVMIVLGIVFYIRVQSATSALVISFINIAAVMIAGFMAYLHHQHDDFVSPDRREKRLGQRAARIERQIALLKDAPQKNKDEVDDFWNAEANSYADEYVAPRKERLKKTTAFLKWGQNFMDTLKQQTEMSYQTALVDLDYNIQQARKDSQMDPMDLDSIPTPALDLDVPDIYGEDPGQDSGEELSQPDNKPDPKPVVPLNGTAGKTAINTVVGLCTWFFMSGCCSNGPVEDLQSKAVLYMSDSSIEAEDITQLPPVEDQIGAVFNAVEFTPYSESMKVDRSSVTAIVSIIGETSFPPAYEDVLEEETTSECQLVASKRRKKQNDFIARVDTLIKREFQAKGLPKSYVISCVCRGLGRLIETGSDVKKAILISDLIQNSETLSFYNYGSDLMYKYDEIAKKADLLCPELQGASVEGLDITAVYLPKPRDDLLSRATREFFTRWFGGKGITITFQPNLPHAVRQAAH